MKVIAIKDYTDTTGMTVAATDTAVVITTSHEDRSLKMLALEVVDGKLTINEDSTMDIDTFAKALGL